MEHLVQLAAVQVEYTQVNMKNRRVGRWIGSVFKRLSFLRSFPKLVRATSIAAWCLGAKLTH